VKTGHDGPYGEDASTKQERHPGEEAPLTARSLIRLVVEDPELSDTADDHPTQRDCKHEQDATDVPCRVHAGECAPERCWRCDCESERNARQSIDERVRLVLRTAGRAPIDHAADIDRD
jgi:hypothetical protein